MVKKEDLEVLARFADAVRRRFPNAEIWGFGSRARGVARNDSDLDVCVVIDALDEQKDKAIMDLAWEVGFDHGFVISSVTYSSEEFRSGPCSESPLVRTILEDGVAA